MSRLLLAWFLLPLPASGQASPQPPTALKLDAAQSAFLEEFGHEMAAAVSSGSPGRFGEVFDGERFAGRVVEGIEVPAEVRDDFVEGMLKELRTSPAALMSGFLGQSYAFLRVHSWDGNPTLLFRLRPSSGGFNYHAFPFELGPPPEIALYDVYVLASGEPLSRTLHRLALPALVQQDRSLLDRLLGRERSFVENMTKFRDMGLKIQAEEYEEALRIHGELPKDLRQDKTVRLLEMNALVHLEGGDERYLQAIERYRDAFPDDPAMSMIVLDYHIVKGDYEVSMGLIEEIGGWVGGDPYLEVMRAVREGLEYLEENFDYAFTEESMAAAPDYADFLQSEQARQYLAGRETEGEEEPPPDPQE